MTEIVEVPEGISDCRKNAVSLEILIEEKKSDHVSIQGSSRHKSE